MRKLIWFVVFAGSFCGADAAIIPVACEGGQGTYAGSSGLVAAIDVANADAESDTIQLAPGCTYAFTSEAINEVIANNYWYGPNVLPAIQSPITIEGNGATLQIALYLPQTNRAVRFFYVSGGFPGELPAGELTLHNLTLEGGYAKGGNTYGGGGGAGMGGAIFNQGTLVLDAVTMVSNVARGGEVGYSGFGGGGIGQDAQGYDGGGFGGEPPALLAYGGLGGTGSDLIGGTGRGGGGGGGGFTSADDGYPAAGDSGAPGGGLGGLGGDLSGPADGGRGGDGTLDSQVAAGIGGHGGAFGQGGSIIVGPWVAGGGGGGVGGGGSGAEFVAGGEGGGGGFAGGGGAAGYASRGGHGGFGGGGGLSTALVVERNAGFGAGSESGGGSGMGGAIFNHAGNITMVNCTLTANVAVGGEKYLFGESGSGLGSAIFNLNGSVDISFSTISQNLVEGTNGQYLDGGNAQIYTLAFGNRISDGGSNHASLTVTNSIVSGDVGDDVVNEVVAGSYWDQNNTSTIKFAQANIVGSIRNDATLDPASTLPFTGAPELSPLATNNAPVSPRTMALTDQSNAYNAAAGACPATDERGVARPQFGACDIGAYELRPFDDRIFADGFD